MQYILIVFRSRSDALACRSHLLSRGVDAVVVNTPQQLTHSCGLSVKTYTPRPVLASALGVWGSRSVGIYAARGNGAAVSYTRV